MQKKENVLPPGLESIVEATLNPYRKEALSDLSRHTHVVKVKVARARYLLWKQSQLTKRLNAIEEELDAMLQEDRQG